MKVALLQFLLIVLTGISGGVIWSACKVQDDAQPPVNKACVVARRMALPNLECDPMGTNLGFYPDTCICQLATSSTDAAGKIVRTPTQVIWVKAGVIDPPEVKSVYQIPPPQMPTPVTHPPQLRKE